MQCILSKNLCVSKHEDDNILKVEEVIILYKYYFLGGVLLPVHVFPSYHINFMWSWYFSSPSQSWKCLSVQTTAAVQVCSALNSEFWRVYYPSWVKRLTNWFKVNKHFDKYSKFIPVSLYGSLKVANWKIFWD